MIKALDIKVFSKEDFPEYLRWFDDAELNLRLGPMKEDDEWLSSVLNDETGPTYSLFLDKELVSVIGIAYPDIQHPMYCITNIAVKPSLRGKGIGKEVLRKTMEFHQLEKDQYWIAYVEEDNTNAKLFFDRNGWKGVSNKHEESGMTLYEYRGQ